MRVRGGRQILDGSRTVREQISEAELRGDVDDLRAWVVDDRLKHRACGCGWIHGHRVPSLFVLTESPMPFDPANPAAELLPVNAGRRWVSCPEPVAPAASPSRLAPPVLPS